MFERFTNRARQAVVHAQQEARRLHHREIGAEHLLLGILAEQHGVGAQVLAGLGMQTEAVRDAVGRRSPAAPDAEALRTLGIDLEEVRRRAEESFGPGALERRRGARRGHIPFTPEAKTALELALRESLRLRNRRIGTEHLLLGLLRRDTRLATALLREAGVDRKTVEARMCSQQGSG